MKKKRIISLLFILLLGASFRMFNMNWDQGYHLHPDERAIILYALPLTFPSSLQQFLSTSSSWNPHFFAYGSFPLYLLRMLGNLAANIDVSYGDYTNINLLGRYVSTTFDSGTIFLIYLVSKRIFSRRAAAIGSLFYAISVLPIQLSHFYAVDTLLTFFIMATLYFLLRFYENPSVRFAIMIGIAFGFSLATKISALVLLVAIGVSLFGDFLLLLRSHIKQPKNILKHVPLFIKRLCVDSLIIYSVTVATFLILEPYALIDFKEFWRQTIDQSHMTKSAFTFPYTLQYVGKTPYLYEIVNIFLWGQGMLLALCSFSGILFYTYQTIKQHAKGKFAKETILLLFFWVYFLIVGSFSIGFIRYLLPVYPLFCIFGGALVYLLYEQILTTALSKHARKLVVFGGYLTFLWWPLSFSAIYTQPNTRVAASEWIYTNIPAHSVLAGEHWDDRLPLTDKISYTYEALPLYDQDTPEKWNNITSILARSDYIIIASNRLHTPLRKLTNCDILPAGRCYTQTAAYYKNLFAGNLGFRKVAEFYHYPTIPFTNIGINDQSADESFTVYDHPHIIILKKTE